MLIFSRREINEIYPELSDSSDIDVLHHLQNYTYKSHTVILELYTVGLYFVYTTKSEVDRAIEIIQTPPINFRTHNTDKKIYQIEFRSSCGVIRNVCILADAYHRVV